MWKRRVGGKSLESSLCERPSVDVEETVETCACHALVIGLVRLTHLIPGLVNQ